MSVDEGLYGWVQEALEPLGAVTRRAMMGGATLYLDGIVFAVIDGSDLWFKADATSDAEWDAVGCERFTVGERDGAPVTMNYHRAPDGVHDDAAELLEWAGLALAAGQRASAKKKPRKPKPAKA